MKSSLVESLDLSPIMDLISAVQGEITKHSEEFQRIVKENQRLDDITARTLVRSFGSLVDGAVFQLKRQVLRLASSGVVTLDPGERAILEEEAYELDQNGTVSVRQRFPPLLPNVRFAFKAFGAAYGSQFSLDVSGAGWQAFDGAIRLRNRVTHPKDAIDLTLTRPDLDGFLDGMLWFAGQLQALLSSCPGRKTHNQRPADAG